MPNREWCLNSNCRLYGRGLKYLPQQWLRIGIRFASPFNVGAPSACSGQFSSDPLKGFWHQPYSPKLRHHRMVEDAEQRLEIRGWR
jgi:hypothetical protein